LKKAEKAAEERKKEVKHHWPVEKKKGAWALQDKVLTLRDDLVKVFSDAQVAFHEALGFERKNPEARAGLAEMYWDQFLRVEEAEIREEMVLYERLLLQYDDGHYEARLKGDGTLAISTRRFPCRCLTEGRMVTPEELKGSVEKQEKDSEHSTHNALHSSRCGIMGYHPFSGGVLGGVQDEPETDEGLPELEPDEPIPLKVHCAECETEALEGADVWLFRYEEHEKILIPVFPRGISIGVECGVSSVEKEEQRNGERGQLLNTLHSTLDTLYDPGSPYRPNEGLHLGRTPVAKFAIPMGSYLLILHKKGFHPVRCPVYIGRLAEEEVSATLYRDGEIPEGFVQVPAGKFIYQGDKKNPFSGRKETRETEDFFLARFPVTCGEYLDFLNELAGNDPEEAAKRVPREAENSGYFWPRCPDGKFVIPTEAWLAEAPLNLGKEAGRLSQCPVDWEKEWPVYCISWEDAIAYSAWFSGKKGILASLPHDYMWEKAARGVDGRTYTFGNHSDYVFANTQNSHDGLNRPCPVDSFPIDESPNGARGLCGNAIDWTISHVGQNRRRLLRGGSWMDAAFYLLSSYRRACTPGFVDYCTGFRLVVAPRTAGPD
jgi:formylglycine-generating enzyme required for sulfatase activity